MSRSSADVTSIVVRPPVAGEVKKRLVPAVRSGLAAELASAFLADALGLASSWDGVRVVVACNGAASPLASGRKAEVWTQGCGDPRLRMERVLRRALDGASAGIASGAGSPGLPRHFLNHAAHSLLEGSDAVVGPCADGGYYLLGIRRCPARLLPGLPWSDASTHNETMPRLRASRLRVAVAEPRFEVDLPADLERFDDLPWRKQVCAPQTEGLLAGLTGFGRPP